MVLAYIYIYICKEFEFLKEKEKKHKSPKTALTEFYWNRKLLQFRMRAEVRQVDYKVFFTTEKKNASTTTHHLPIRVIKDKSDENENLQSKIVV